MQQPTCTNVRIRSTHDAHKIFFAIQKNRLFMVTRRLDVDERNALRSGCVYAWEERGPHTEITGLGIERFTEGRRWSPSRVRDEFLFYYEKYTPPQDATQASVTTEKQPPRDWDPLVKQTYSVWVDTDRGRRKWHLTAYFTQATVDQMGTIDNIPDVKDLDVPEGLFQSTRVGKNRKTDDSRGRASSEVSKPVTSSTVTRTYAPFLSSHSTPNIRSAASSYQSMDYTQGQTHYSLPSSSLPPIRDPNYDSQPRAVASPSHQMGYGGHLSSEYTSYLSTSGTRVTEHTPPRSYSSYAIQDSSQVHAALLSQSASFYPNDTHSAHPQYVWYPPMQEPSAELSSSPSLQHTEMPNAFPFRSSYPSDQGQVSSSQLYPQMYPYSDPNMDPSTHASVYPRSQPQLLTHAPFPSDSLSARTFPVHSGQSFSSPQRARSYDGSPSPPDYDMERRRASLGPTRVALAPLNELRRSHPYRRHPVDDRALRQLNGLPDLL